MMEKIGIQCPCCLKMFNFCVPENLSVVIESIPQVNEGVLLCLNCPCCHYPVGLIWDDGFVGIYYSFPIDPSKATGQQETIKAASEAAARSFDLKFSNYRAILMVERDTDYSQASTQAQVEDPAYSRGRLRPEDVNYFRSALSKMRRAKDIEII